MGQMSTYMGMRPANLFACSVFLFGVDVPEARAGGAFAISTQGAYALGTAFAGVASGSAGLPSIYWNPATITRFEGRNVSGGATYVFPYADITPQAGTAEQVLDFGGTGDIAEDALIPTFQLGWEVIREKLWLGLSINAPFGLSTHAPDTTASQLYGRKSEAVSFSVSPLSEVFKADVSFWMLYNCAHLQPT